MKGQWIGRYIGNVGGKLMVNIDQVSGHFEGVAYVYPDDGNLPSSAAYFQTESKDNSHEVIAYINPIDPRTGFQCKWDEIRELFDEEVTHSEEATVTIKLSDNKLYVQATSDIGVAFSSTLEKPEEKSGSRVDGTKMTWQEFKTFISNISKTKFLFRGQKEPWRLQTSFHRGGRYRISEFIKSDVPQLHQRLSAITSHYFDLTSPQQNGAFFNLLQHHGYPTPLLDWSYSPYVSAFFAFRGWPIGYEGDGYIRIYIFNNEAWRSKYPQIENLDPSYPHFSVMDFIAINNPRVVPQQAVTTVTNIDDIEAYILDRESDSQVNYIRAIDILASERENAMRDLRFMGITAGSMFPTIDGMCEEFKESNFDGYV